MALKESPHSQSFLFSFGYQIVKYYIDSKKCHLFLVLNIIYYPACLSATKNILIVNKFVKKVVILIDLRLIVTRASLLGSIINSLDPWSKM